MTTLRRATIALLTLALVAATACSKSADGEGDGSADEPRTIPAGGIQHPLGADEVVLQVSDTGGFVPEAIRTGGWPRFSLYGNGLIIQPGPQIEIYPPPARPAMVSQTVTEEGVQEILTAAQEAGLTDGNHTYPNAEVFDATTTVFVVNANDTKNVTSVYALGIPGGANGHTPPAEAAARKKIDAFAIQLQALGTWLPEGSLGIERQYTPSGLVVFASPYVEPDQQDLTQPDQPWPLEEPLSTLGPIMPESDVRCGVVTGEDFQTLWAATASANQLTPWTSGGERYSVVFRPLLPNETSCPKAD